MFYLPDSILLGNNPTNTAYEWVNITGNLKTLAYTIFGQAYNPATDPNSTKYNQAVILSSIVADWRYAIPNSPTYANGPTYHPVLYVGAGNPYTGTGSGVYQSVDGGQTWTYFPDTTYGAVVEGGYLPHVAVTSLSLSLGDTNVATGMPTLDGPYAPATVNQTAALAADPDTLMAATYGQGEFAINLAPLILGDEVTVSPTTAGTGTGSSPVVTGPITISGSSEISGFGNATWITVEDVTNPANPVVIAGFNPADPVPTPSSSNSTNALGNFSIPFNPASYYMTNGPKTIEIFATDNAGSVGNKVTYSFTLNDNSLPQPPPTAPPSFVPPGLQMLPADLKGTLNGNPVTNIETPEFLGATNPGVTITVFETQEVNGVFPPPTLQFTLPSSDISPNGSFNFLFQNPPNSSGQPPLPNGTFQVYVQAAYTLYPSLGSTQSNTVTFRIDNTTPAQVTDFRLNPTSDTGIVGDNVTSDRTPQFIGTAATGDTVELVQLINFTGTLTSGSASVTGISSTTGLAAGESVISPDLPSGTTILTVNSSNATIMLSASATASGSQSLTATAYQASTTATATTEDDKGAPYDFSIQLPFTLTNGTIELGVIVVDVPQRQCLPVEQSGDRGDRLRRVRLQCRQLCRRGPLQPRYHLHRHTDEGIGVRHGHQQHDGAGRRGVCHRHWRPFWDDDPDRQQLDRHHALGERDGHGLPEPHGTQPGAVARSNDIACPDVPRSSSVLVHQRHVLRPRQRHPLPG